MNTFLHMLLENVLFIITILFRSVVWYTLLKMKEEVRNSNAPNNSINPYVCFGLAACMVLGKELSMWRRESFPILEAIILLFWPWFQVSLRELLSELWAKALSSTSHSVEVTCFMLWSSERIFEKSFIVFSLDLMQDLSVTQPEEYSLYYSKIERNIPPKSLMVRWLWKSKLLEQFGCCQGRMVPRDGKSNPHLWLPVPFRPPQINLMTFLLYLLAHERGELSQLIPFSSLPWMVL